MSIQHKYGPFSPQELDPILKWLDQGNIAFEIIKDENVENQFKDNSPANMLALTEFRTQVYLAQIFHVLIDFADADLQKRFENKFISKTEVIPIWLGKLTRPVDVSPASKKPGFSKKNFWAAVILILMLAYIFMNYMIR